MFTRTGACNGTRTTKRLVGEFAQFIIVSAAAAAVICSSSQFVIPFYLSGNRFVTILLFLLSMLLNMAGTMQCGNKYQPQNLAWERTHLHWKTKDRWSAALRIMNAHQTPNKPTNIHFIFNSLVRTLVQNFSKCSSQNWFIAIVRILQLLVFWECALFLLSRFGSDDGKIHLRKLPLCWFNPPNSFVCVHTTLVLHFRLTNRTEPNQSTIYMPAQV